MTIDEQILWVGSQIRHMKKVFPDRVDQGKLTQEQASYRLAVAQSTLETLTQLRGLVQRGVKEGAA